MATPKTQSTTISDHQTCTKAHRFLSLLALLFIFILLTTSTKVPINPTNMAASISIKRLLLESSEPASTTMNLHPKQTQDARTSSSSTSSSKSTRTKFGAAAHEVPSGPNPISNR
ncbi:hypothetical protein POPTR_012G019400v4 [Populus trichocarpa]|uniref:CLE41b n=2 Tax=Populus trichocarpa TaxID=3694 RepID=A0AAU7LLP3_POPTR|nr:hypothetical protein POPTR_012G019400v4 [Populus trichocarpa]